MDPIQDEKQQRLDWLRHERHYRALRGVRSPAWLEEEIKSAEAALRVSEVDQPRPAPIPLAAWVALLALALSIAAAWGWLT